MNKLFLTAILILCLPAATAVTLNMSAGEQEYITLTDSPSSCVMVEDQNNSYSLTNYSTDGLNLTINGNNVTINTNPALKPGNYTLICNYSFAEEPTTSSGSGGYSSSWICNNWSECINNKMKRVCIKGTNNNINYTQSKSCVSKTKPKEVKEEEIKVEEEAEIIANITVTIDKNETKTEVPTEEQQGWVYLGIIIITIMFIIFGVIYVIRKSNSES